MDGIIIALDLNHQKAREEVARLMRVSFLKVAEDYGLTPENCPTHPAFISAIHLQEMHNHGHRIFGYLSEGIFLKGCIALAPAGTGCIEIEKLAVHPELRHRGIGNRLMRFMENEARKSDILKTKLALINENHRLKEWYLSQGYQETETRKFPHLPFTVCFMEKEL